MKLSIQLKILIAFSVIIFIGLSALLFVSYKLTEQNDNSIINADMIAAKKNLDQYLKQYFLINHLDFTGASLISQAEDISVQLSFAIGSDVDIYNMNGNEMSHNLEPGYISMKNEDLINAMKGKISYATVTNENGTKVSLSYPIQVNNANIGIIRYTKDYTQLFNNSKRFRYVINIFAAVIFTVIFIAALILSKQITKPIKKLAETTERVSNGNFDIDIVVNSKDEIGDLATRFKIMLERIKSQIEIIKEDRDALKEAQSRNKIFFDNVTHELKTPITVISGYAQAMKENGFSDRNMYDKAVFYISDESRRLNNMVVELLELSKVSSTNFKYFFENADIGDLVRQTCEEMQIKAKKYNIDIRSNVPENLFLICDRDRLKEVLINLIDNSIKYGNVNSSIEVRAYREGEKVFIRVKDEGEGISEDNINKLFEPFFRVSKKVSRESGSAGLGLTIVKNIVEKHGGAIEVQSKLKEGTEVIIRLEDDFLC